MLPLDHLLLDRSSNIGPLRSCWELDKFENCWNKSFRTSKILTLWYQQFSNLWISQRDTSGPRLGALSNNSWSWGILFIVDGIWPYYSQDSRSRCHQKNGRGPLVWAAAVGEPVLRSRVHFSCPAVVRLRRWGLFSLLFTSPLQRVWIWRLEFLCPYFIPLVADSFRELGPSVVGRTCEDYDFQNYVLTWWWPLWLLKLILLRS